MAKEFAEIGFNMNLGPVVDLNVNPRNPVVGAVGRSFSQDPKSRSRCARRRGVGAEINRVEDQSIFRFAASHCAAVTGR